MIDKKLITYATRTKFNTDKTAGLIPNTSVVFIQDTGEIWTHEIFFGGNFSSVDLNYGTLLTKGHSFDLSLYGHKHAYTDLTGSTTTANQAIVSSGTTDGWILKTLDYLSLAGGVMNGNISMNNSYSITNLPIGGGISWNPYVESSSDNSDAAYIQMIAGGIAGGTTLQIVQQNDATDTILFVTNGNSNLYHNSNILLNSANYSNYSLPLSGGVMNGIINTARIANSWSGGRNNAAIRYGNNVNNDTVSFFPFLSMQSNSGNTLVYGGYLDTFGFYGYNASETNNTYDWALLVDSASGNWHVLNGSLDIDNTLSAGAIGCGYTSGLSGSISCSNWFRSSGLTGWYNDIYGGGIFMIDSTYVRSYNDKKFWAPGFTHSGYNSSGYVLTSDGGATAINGLSVAQANLVRTDATGTNSATLLYSCMADNDFFRILVGGTTSNAGFAEIATADDGNEPIYVRLYQGVFTNVLRTATLLDEGGNTIFPGIIYQNLGQYKVLDENNYTSYALPLGGGEMVGPISIFPNQKQIIFRPQADWYGSIGYDTFGYECLGIMFKHINTKFKVKAGYDSSTFVGGGAYTNMVDADLEIGNGYGKIAGNTIWHAGNDGSGSGLDADLLDGQHAYQFLRCDSSSFNDQLNGNFAIGNANSRNFIQSHNGQPLDLNPLGNTVTVNGGLVVTNAGTWGISISGNAASVTNGMYTNGNQASTTHKQFYTSDPGGDYSTRAIELREVGLTTSAYLTDQNYAPALGFHWGGITQAIMSLHTDGAFHFTSGGTSASTPYTNLIAGGFCKSGYNNSYVLLGNGDAASITELGVSFRSLTDVIQTGNEFNFAPPGYNNVMWINYLDRTLRNSTALISAYHIGNGHSGYADVVANIFYGSLSGNADTATKLQTARSLWGNSFDGTSDISGQIDLGGHCNLPAIRFRPIIGGYDTAIGYDSAGVESLAFMAKAAGTTFKFKSGYDPASFTITSFVNMTNADLEIGNGYAKINGNSVWHAGNDGSGSGLDADLLDGLHGDEYLRKHPSEVGSSLDLNNCSGVNIHSGYNITNSPYVGDVSILTIPLWNGGGKYSTQFVFGISPTVNPYFRRTDVNGEGTWQQLAFISDNVASATKLSTSRTIWGQNFDGTANISGALTEVSTISMSGQLTSTLASGTAPFSITSTTLNSNLNADLLDGQHGSYYTGYADTNFLKLSGGTLTDTLYTYSDIFFNNISTGIRGIAGLIANNDGWYILGEGISDNNGALRIGTFDDGTEPIYVSLGGNRTSFTRTLTLLDSNGNTSMPGSLTVTNNVLATIFEGDLSGNADTATNATNTTNVIVQLHSGNNVNYPIVWSNLSNTNTTTANQLFKTGYNLYFNPNSMVLTSTGGFNGNLLGNASSATLANSITSTSPSSTLGYILALTASGTTPIYDTGIYINTTLKNITASTFTGSLVGNASTSNTATILLNSRTLWGLNFNGSSDISGQISNTGNITPSSNNTYTVGVSADYYLAMYASTFYGSLSGTASYATYAGHVTNSISFKNISNTTVTYNGSGPLDLTGGIYYSATSGNANTVGTCGESSFIRYRGILTGPTHLALGIYGWSDGSYATNNLPSQFGDALEIVGYSTWYHRLCFNTNGTLSFYLGINTTTMSFKGTLAFAENVPTKTGTGASGNWGISITGNATTATSASSATLASTISSNANTTTLGYILALTASGTTPFYDTGVYISTTPGNLVATTFTGSLSGNATSATHLYSDGSLAGTSMIFHWSGQGGQPVWLWGGNSASDMYVYNPSNFSVNYAASSNITNTLSYLGLQTMDTSGTLTSGVQCYGVYNNGYPTTYGNVLNIAGGGYGQILIGWSITSGAHADNYIRSLRDTAKGTNGWSDWAKIITSANYNTYALPLSGGTLTGLLTTNAGIASTTGTFSSTLGVTGATTLSSTLGVSGTTTLSNTLGVTGATTLGSTLEVSGLTTLGNGLLVAGGVTTYDLYFNGAINDLTITNTTGVDMISFGLNEIWLGTNFTSTIKGGIFIGNSYTTNTILGTINTILGTANFTGGVNCLGALSKNNGIYGPIPTMLFSGLFGYDVGSSTIINSVYNNSTGVTPTFTRISLGKYSLVFDTPNRFSLRIICLARYETDNANKGLACVSCFVTTSGTTLTIHILCADDTYVNDVKFDLYMFYY